MASLVLLKRKDIKKIKDYEMKSVDDKKTVMKCIKKGMNGIQSPFIPIIYR